jgi:uncharacterized glyoxalase superfamily protein PhnB
MVGVEPEEHPMTGRATPPCIVPTFRYRDADRMIAWLQQAFGFELHVRYADDEKVAHAQLTLGSSMIMLGEARDDAYGRMVGAPGDNGGKSVYVAVPDSDAVYRRAKAAGAEILEEPADQEYGDRRYAAKDPEGHHWFFAQKVKEVAPEAWGAIPA